jgi:hypothetical protein
MKYSLCAHIVTVQLSAFIVLWPNINYASLIF